MLVPAVSRQEFSIRPPRVRVLYFATMSTMTAIFENGVFRPLGTVKLPEHTRVEISLPDAAAAPSDAALDAVYEALQIRFRSGCGDLAARHNEHQP